MKISDYVEGKFLESSCEKKVDVINPSTLKKLGETSLGGEKELLRAVESCKKAFPGWSETPAIERVQPLFRLKTLLEKNFEDISVIRPRAWEDFKRSAWGSFKRTPNG